MELRAQANAHRAQLKLMSNELLLYTINNESSHHFSIELQFFESSKRHYS